MSGYQQIILVEIFHQNFDKIVSLKVKLLCNKQSISEYPSEQKRPMINLKTAAMLFLIST